MERSTSRMLLLAIASIFLISDTKGANILGVFPSFSPSHVIVQMAMINVLAENGHNVTVITTIKPPVCHKDVNVVHLPLAEEDQKKLSKTIATMASTDNSNMLLSMFRVMGQMKFAFDKMRDLAMEQRFKDVYEHKDNKFDLVMLGYLLNEYQIGIAHKLKVPVVIAASMPPNEILDCLIGNSQAVSFVPAMTMTVQKGQSMSLLQRIKNYIGSISIKVLIMIINRYNAHIYEKIYGDDPNMPEFEEAKKNVSLVFSSTHTLSEGPIRTTVPAYIEVGGIQIKDTPDPLPQAMADFLNDAADGAILLSLGSNVKGTHLKPDTVQKMFNVLSKLKQRVIWKWEDLDKVPGKSDNILFSKWLPQDDILAHPKVILFITHAGKGGITESQYHGKPMLALPIFGDQPTNADKMVLDGFGLSMSLLTLEEKDFRDNIVELLENPQYAQKVKEFSQLYRDRPLTARQNVVYWTEYVLRHHGAAHLQSPLVHMNFIAANNLDVYALLLTILFVIVFVSKFALTRICRKFKGKTRKAKKTKRS